MSQLVSESAVKVVPIREMSLESSAETYQQLFSDVSRYVDMKLKWRGIHSLICQQLGSELENKSLMDVGCGYGRFSFLAAKKARHVTGIDMTPEAHRVALVLREATGTKNVDFACTPIEEYTNAKESYDIVVLGGVLEHLIDPASVMQTISRMLKPGGLLISNSPVESNFRGYVSTTLWKLFDFPMSLSDVRLVSGEYMQELASCYGYEIEKTLGVCYERGWAKQALEDLPDRMKNVMQDVKTLHPSLRPDHEQFRLWVEEQALLNSRLLSDWQQRGILKKIPNREEIEFDESIVEQSGLPVENLKRFLAADFSMDPWYTDIAPYNLMGSQAIFFMRKHE